MLKLPRRMHEDFMKIVLLDAYTLNPGDLSWEPLLAMGDVQMHERTPASMIIERGRDADIVLTNKVPVSRETLEQWPHLRAIVVLATGYNVVDVEAAAERGIPVMNVPSYSTASVAQLTFALLLELAQHVGHHAHTVREGKWSASPDFCYWERPLLELHGLTLGIVGYGTIGREVATIARAFGMKVLACRSRNVECPEEGIVTLETLLRSSDVVSLHCPLTPDNHGFINAETLALMKRGAILINTSRGPLINEADLAAALESGQLAGAGLDVLSSEPPSPENPLLRARNCMVTPHIAWATRAARQRLLNTVVSNIQSFLAGKPHNVVNAPRS